MTSLPSLPRYSLAENVVQECPGVKDGCASEQDIHGQLGSIRSLACHSRAGPGLVSPLLVELSHEPRFLVCSTSKQKDDHILWCFGAIWSRQLAVARHVRIVGLGELILRQVFESVQKEGLVLSVDVLHALDPTLDGLLGTGKHILGLVEVSLASAGPALLEELGHEAQLLRAHAVRLEKVHEAVEGVALLSLVAQRVEEHEAHLVCGVHCGVAHQLLHLLHRLCVVVRARELLLHLAHGHELPRVHHAAELGHEGHVLAHVAAELPELGVVLHKGLHVGDGVDLARGVGLGLVLVHQGLHVGAQLAKVEEHVLRVERVLVRGENNLALILSRVRGVAQVHAAVVNAQELMHHGLVGPLVEQGRDRILAPVQDEEEGGRVARAKGEEFGLLINDRAHLGSEELRGLRVTLVANGRAQLEREQHRQKALLHTLEERCVVARAAQGRHVRHVQAEQLRVHGEVVGEHLLHLADDLVLVCVCQLPQGCSGDYVCEEYMVLAEAGLLERLADALHVVRRRSHEVHATKVRHGVHVWLRERVDEQHLLLQNLRL
mmetsp:Transcript_14814/g.39879  ORF Transcript_14814/g.39879 Transcript_14814/m.39879 type:complete len:549 (-) Transcript_14814:165-1811(-)